MTPCLLPPSAPLHHHLEGQISFPSRLYRALGILIHEMLTATPPFGYHGGEDLQRRIAAGIPSRRGSSEANEGDKEKERGTMHSETTRTDREVDATTYYLPIVRRV